MMEERLVRESAGSKAISSFTAAILESVTPLIPASANLPAVAGLAFASFTSNSARAAF